MRRPTSFVLSALVAAALAMPMPADAQATRRGGGSSGDSGSSGGGATTRSSPSGGGGGGSAAPRVAVPRVSAPPPSSAGSSGSSSRAGDGSSRPSGTVSSGSRVRSTGSAATSGVATGASRSRGNRAAIGSAQPRGTGGGPSTPSIWVPYYPWYSYGPSSHFGLWSRYSWYDPFGYNFYGYGYPYGYGYGGYGGYGPFGYDPFGFGVGHHYWGTPYYVTVNDEDDRRDEAFGSLRLRASPDHARVYVDGALAGTVDDFNGLTNHLELQQGVHQIELRADGYEVYTVEVEVEAGKTRTARASLERLGDQ